ncbi:hypothetical protein FA13DRAFT_1730952 [Coprinellus micaceus]|uniref:Nephrocystin 3-like N-terminal domain-containing protein n=1 Tax=Coprinellus micaceus TaxID=71717 RepID=A0A4Y7TI00_COPMI|nr:hypothetical protein FA13DRAFT_1730952 [Coprinellus micaceus]
MASYITDAQQFKIDSFLALPQGNAIVYNGRGKSPLERLEENIAPGAMHNSSERCDAPKCHPQTRIALQRDIFATLKRIVLLKGAKGTGKTAIAGSIADISQERGLLAGSFFFSSVSKSANRRSKRYLIATLTYQLWQHPALRQHIGQRILSAIEYDPVIFTRGMKAQMEELILEPLRAIQVAGVVLSNGPRVIIQYHDPTLGSPSQGQAQRANEDDQLDILRVLLHAAASPVFPFRIIVTSRSEAPSIAISECLEANPITVDISLDGRPDTDADMTAFLVARFAEIQRRHSLPLNWPHQGYILQLVANAAGSFRLASATMRNISENTTRGVPVPPTQPQEPPDSIPDEGKDPEQPKQKQQVRWDVEPSQRIPMQVSTGERPADNQAKKFVPR